MAALSLGAAACSDDDDDDDEPEISFVRLTVTPPGGQPVSYDLRENASQNQTIAFRVGTNTVTAVGIGENNRTLDLDAEFEVRIVGSVSAQDVEGPLPTGVTFTRNGTLRNAQLVTTAAITTPASGVVRMFHRGEQHSDFDAAIRFTVAP
jgi:hypothetical protein